MNFMNFLTSGANLFNFNLQNMTSSSVKESKNMANESQHGKTEFSKEQKAQIKLNPQQQMQILNKQQFLINQYMHMNIQLLNQKLQCLEKQPKQELKIKIEPQVEEYQHKESKKKAKKVIKCQHRQREHYAKGLCNNCYHKYGRNKKPWNCSHDKLYAAGMCQNCYINNYNKKRRQNKVKEEDEVQVKSELQAKSEIQIQKQEFNGKNQGFMAQQTEK